LGLLDWYIKRVMKKNIPPEYAERVSGGANDELPDAGGGRPKWGKDSEPSVPKKKKADGKILHREEIPRYDWSKRGKGRTPPDRNKNECFISAKDKWDK